MTRDSHASLWSFLGAIMLCTSTVVGLGPRGWAQEQVGGFTPTLPAIPVRAPRRAEGTDTTERFAVERAAPDNSPTAAFVASLSGNDSVYEVVVGQGRLLTLRSPIATEDQSALVAVGDPTVVDFEVLPNARMIRITGRRPGVTDLSITTADGQTYAFEVRVGYDLRLLEVQLSQIFPDASIHLRQMGQHVVVEGEARSPAQITRILETLGSNLQTLSETSAAGGASQRVGGQAAAQDGQSTQSSASPNVGRGGRALSSAYLPLMINLLRVPSGQQVMLQVRIAELDRTALREIGADLKAEIGNNIIGTQISNAVVDPLGFFDVGTKTTAFGIFRGGDFQVFLRALRRNTVLNILAEPNLIAMSGHQASFLAGGQFPVPVPQASGGLNNSVTVEFKDFGVQLDFLPTVLEDETIRLKVEPEVSSIDPALGTTLVVGGDPVPGVNSRAVSTTVELKEGHTLAIAGLLQVELDAQTDRIPGLGDLPVLGPMFSNTRHERTEKELIVLVTPYLVEPLGGCETFPLPGEGVPDPTDLEFYLLNRIEGKHGTYYRSTTGWHCDCGVEQILFEQNHVIGDFGFSE